MRRVLRIIGWGLLALVGLVLVIYVGASVQASRRLARTYEVEVPALTIPTDPESLARGEHLLAGVVSCRTCHGEDFSGSVADDIPPLLRMQPPNITGGAGTRTEHYTDADWVRTVRHCVNPEGRGLFIMPCGNYTDLSDADLGAIIAVIRAAPDVPATSRGGIELYWLGRAMLGLGFFDDYLPADHIDHTAPRGAEPDASDPIAVGRYLAVTGGCHECHGAGLSGGPMPGAPPSLPPPRNLTETGIGAWSDEEFARAMREGTTPDGRTLGAERPWRTFARMTDEELANLRAYLRSVPPLEYGNR